MHMAFLCPICEQQTQCECDDRTATLQCGHCDWKRPIPEDAISRGAIQTCVACGCEDLWKQRDFPLWLGISIVAFATILSTIAVALYENTWALGILMAFGLLDYVFYAIMPDVLVCYRCRARYRHSADENAIPRFNHETAERYRQEELRLGQSANPATLTQDTHSQQD